MTPAPEDITYPTVLDFAAPKLRAYPLYTVVAEKFQAMVWLGIANSRMKDFYDIWIIMQKFPIEGHVLGAAIEATPLQIPHRASGGCRLVPVAASPRS